MSKSKLILDVVADICSLAESLKSLADAFLENESVEAPQKNITAKKFDSKKKETTLEEVRAALAVKSQAGLTAEVREMIQKYGGSKLSEIAPEHYADILKDAEVLGNG